MSLENFKKTVQKAQDKWAAGVEEAKKFSGGDFLPVPVGFYIVKPTVLELAETKDGRAYIKTAFTVSEETDEVKVGTDLRPLYMLEGKDEEETERLIKNACILIAQLGYELDLDDIPGSMEEIFTEVITEGPHFRVEVYESKSKTTDKTYKNFRINRRVDDGGSSSEDDNEPFNDEDEEEKPKSAANTVASKPAPAQEEAPKKRGRPAGSTNKPKETPKPAPKAEEDDEDEDGDVEIEVGMKVKFTSSKYGELQGEIVELFEEDGAVRIKCDSINKTIKVGAEKIDSIVSEDDEDSDEDEDEE